MSPPRSKLGLCTVCKLGLEDGITERLKHPLLEDMATTDGKDEQFLICETKFAQQRDVVFDQRFTCWLCARIFSFAHLLVHSPYWTTPSSEVTLPERLLIALRFVHKPKRHGRKNELFELRIWHADDNQYLGLGGGILAREESQTEDSYPSDMRLLDQMIYTSVENYPNGSSGPRRFSLIAEPAPPTADMGDYLEKVGAASNGGHEPDAPNEIRIGVLKAWLDRCLSDHGCWLPQGSASNIFPLRLLHIYPGAQQVRLIPKAEFVQDIQYTTLSYCWGRDPPFRLEESNFATLTRGISTTLLGATIRQAIHLSDALGVSYIWIDSLCIIQDSQDDADWLRHTPIIGSIYGHSFLNIAANASTSWKDGLWQSLEPVRLRNMVLKIPDGAAYCSSQSASFTGSVAREIRQHFTHLPLSRRGWCTQEMFFSPRTLHVTDCQMSWHCRAAVDCEFYGAHWAYPIAKPFNPSAVLTYDLDWQWLSVIDAYAETKVTYPRDRYFALASLAAWFATCYRAIGTETRYCVGHWEHHLRESLLWSSPSVVEEEDCPITLPSWSWMRSYRRVPTMITSLHRHPYYSWGELQHYFMSVIRIDIRAGKRLFIYGPVESAVLHLRGPLLRLKLQDAGAVLSDYSKLHLLTSSSSSLASIGGESKFDIPHLAPNNMTAPRCRVRFYSIVEESMEELEKYVLAPVGYYRALNGMCRAIFCIVLEQCADVKGSNSPLTFKHRGCIVFTLQTLRDALASSFLDTKNMVIHDDHSDDTKPTLGGQDVPSSRNVLAELSSFISSVSAEDFCLV